MLNLVVRKVTTERSENFEVSKSALELPDIVKKYFFFYFEMFIATGKRRAVRGKCLFLL
jgi:hypothetical protein